MSQPDSARRQLLLELIAGRLESATELSLLFNDIDWTALNEAARQHRLQPLLHHVIKSSSLTPAIPAAMVNNWADAHRSSAVRSLSLQAVLLDIDDALQRAGIRYAALKGAWLAWHAYPAPALRPMRDIDILVAADTVRAALAALQARGFNFVDEPASPFDEMLRLHKHLPGLWSAKHRVMVELHVRLIETPSSSTSQNLFDDANRLLDNRTERLAGSRKVSFLAETDTLLHLIVHSVYEHQFNNGPAIINDVVHILRTAQIDWPQFWQMARAHAWVPGCALIFDLVEHYHGIRCDSIDQERLSKTPTKILHHAAGLMLQDVCDRHAISFWFQIGSSRSMIDGYSRLNARIKHLSTKVTKSGGSTNAVMRLSAWHHFHRLVIICIDRVVGLKRSVTRADLRRNFAVDTWLNKR